MASLAPTTRKQLQEVWALFQALKGPRKGSSVIVERLERIAERSGSMKVRESVIRGLVRELRTTEFKEHAEKVLLTIEVFNRVYGSQRLSRNTVRLLGAEDFRSKAVSREEILASAGRIAKDAGLELPAVRPMPEETGLNAFWAPWGTLPSKPKKFYAVTIAAGMGLTIPAVMLGLSPLAGLIASALLVADGYLLAMGMWVASPIKVAKLGYYFRHGIWPDFDPNFKHSFSVGERVIVDLKDPGDGVIEGMDPQGRAVVKLDRQKYGVDNYAHAWVDDLAMTSGKAYGLEIGDRVVAGGGAATVTGFAGGGVVFIDWDMADSQGVFRSGQHEKLLATDLTLLHDGSSPPGLRAPASPLKVGDSVGYKGTIARIVGVSEYSALIMWDAEDRGGSHFPAKFLITTPSELVRLNESSAALEAAGA
ncbi:MAG: hypothetical protein WC943_08570 [Elusimicrobiota bacterium]